MKRFPVLWSAFLSLALIQPLPLKAAVISLLPVADTTLQEAFPGNNLGDGTSFQAGGRRQGGRTRALLRFDIAGNVPAGSTISSVSLSLSVTAVPSGGANSLFDLNRMQNSWGEGTGSDHGGRPAGAGEASWNNRLGSGTPWVTPGGDFLATVSASRSISGAGNYTFASTSTLVADVQGWLDNPATAFGWVLRSESEFVPTSIRRFGSRNDGTFAPVLAITYAVPEPASISLVALALALVRRRRRS